MVWRLCRDQIGKSTTSIPTMFWRRKATAVSRQLLQFVQPDKFLKPARGSVPGSESYPAHHGSLYCRSGKDCRYRHFVPAVAVRFEVGLLEELCEEIFVEQLASWVADASSWPTARSFDVFCRWFDYRHHSMLFDLCDEPLMHE